MDSKDLLITVCAKALKDRGLDTPAYRDRLTREIREVETQSEYDYFVDLYRRKVKYPANENNLIVPFLMGIVDDFNVGVEPVFVYGDFPDVDIDYLPDVQSYLKRDWAVKKFGREYICEIGNYTTFGIKSALIDMARVHGKDRNEILEITKKLGLKDDDGKDLTFEKALELFPELKAYCDANPDVADAARRLVNRNRGMGKHAGGLVISKSRIDDLVPLVVDAEGNYVSAFVEGLHGTDLGPLGLIKFDVLVVVDLKRIAECVKLIKDRHGVKSICAIPGQKDWSDTSYLDDPDCLSAANAAELTGVFQFDGDGIQKLVRQGGVTSFDDLVAYVSLYRPAAMQLDGHNTYTRRKKGQEIFEVHPLMKSFLEKTFGIMVYQEQCLRMLHDVGDVPWMFCEKARKAISKKKEKDFLPYKNMFITNGMRNLGWSQEQVEELWDQIAAWSGYGFNLSHAVAYCYTSARLLWLKKHYPMEFFTATLRCEGEFAKVMKYKMEAEKCGVKVHKLDLNKSKWEFDVVEGEIYLGFFNVKGIGEEVAKRITAGQPYVDLEDFLVRFGTEAVVLKPLIGLGTFGPDRMKLFEFYENYKEQMHKRVERDKRAERTRQEIVDQMRYVLPEFQQPQVEQLLEQWCRIEDKEEFYRMSQLSQEPLQGEQDSRAVQGYRLARKYRKNVDLIKKKKAEDAPIRFADFVPTGKLEDEKVEKILTGIMELAEVQWYGFGWDHILLSSPDFTGRTFAQFDDEEVHTTQVEVQVIRVAEKKTSKKGNSYYSMQVQDANWQSAWVTIWEDDFLIFSEEFTAWGGDQMKGNLMKIRLTRPDAGFPSYKFDSPPRYARAKVIPKEKRLDPRVELMRRPEVI